MSVTFNVKAKGTTCLTVTFATEAFGTPGNPPNAPAIQAVLDSQPSPQSDVLLTGDGDGFIAARSFTFFFPAVTKGMHTMKIRWRSFNGGSVYLGDDTLVVLHG
jgi:hypothetical protein